MYKNQNVLGGIHPGKKVLSPLYTSLQYLNLQIVFNQMTASKSVFCRTVVITKREKILLLEIYCL